MSTNWYVLSVRHRKERFVEEQLLSKRVKAVCPRVSKVVRHARRTKTVNVPLFPGYIFVALDEERRSWREVNCTQGADGLVMFANKPSPLHPQFVSDFIECVGADGIVQFKSELKIGDRVRAVGGPFDSLAGEIIEMSDDARVKILMSALNRKVETMLPRTAVMIAA